MSERRIKSPELDASIERWDIIPETNIRGYTIEWAEHDYFILSKAERLYETCSLDGHFTPLGAYPCASWKRAAARFRLLQRLLRHMFYNVFKLLDGRLFLTFGDGVGIYNGGYIHILEGLLRPCRVLRFGCAVDKNGDVFFGEYLSNERRSPVRIYRYPQGGSHLEVAYTFPPGSIRHVHGIYRDPYTDDLFCVTGDRGSECCIFRTVDGFKNLEIVGKGDEAWRCVSLLFTEEGIYYATDAEFRTNRIYRIDRETGRRDMLGRLDGPVYYSYSLGNDLFFGVTAELYQTKEGGLASLWHVSEDGKIENLISIKKDVYPVKPFLPGTLIFPQGPGLPNMFYFGCLGLKACDNHTYSVRKRLF